MVVGESVELFIVFGVVLLSLFILVVIDRIGVVRGPLEDDEEEV